MIRVLYTAHGRAANQCSLRDPVVVTGYMLVGLGSKPPALWEIYVTYQCRKSILVFLMNRQDVFTIHDFYTNSFLNIAKKLRTHVNTLAQTGKSIPYTCLYDLVLYKKIQWVRI